ncbi:cell wall hydrolase [Jannaschia sp. Os4]|uniref:cell wall hydrolase n=1 Tax=Jannaschia sp. Os4 TaxID=2807617 RepID=UPI001EEEDF2C|nr:cell wall hydrolase [Jannaschia sp. Os4]
MIAALGLAATAPAAHAAGAMIAPVDTLLDAALDGEILVPASFAEPEDAPAAEALPPAYTRARLDAMPRATGGKEFACLKEAIYFEARGEPIRGQYAVAEVIMNRVDSKRYPDTICGVVNQGTGRLHACQFSYTCDGLPETMTERRAADIAGKIAREVMDGKERRITGDATHYHADYVDPYWNKVYPRTATVGTHIFYKQIPGA